MGDCWHCDRYFEHSRSLHQHAQSKHPDTYCTRCRRFFSSTRAKQQHVANSKFHNFCERCPEQPEFASLAELNNHAETVHYCCTVCDYCFNGPDQLAQHDVDEHNLCETCGTYLSSPSNLKSHLQTHAEKTVSCPGCPKMFVSKSAMVLHLEAGTCESGADCDRVTEIAFECFLSGRYTCDDNLDFPFKCPTCDTPFSWISGLLQHVESDSCSEALAKGTPLGKFLRFLQSQIQA
ncbi:uncharacterized protein P884DRAFT_229550 [Thermothelomyces heterothallicus CBS 202.75]|uniref:uncharacterized protein n=1 Tax=Thermothelomyces heterothallicus CBS 202.75 TaxID=1149848 RepID=UPI0037444025